MKCYPLQKIQRFWLVLTDRSIQNNEEFPQTNKRYRIYRVQNFPTVGLIDGQFRQNLEETDMVTTKR